MKVRRYKYIHTETIEEEHVPRKRRRTIVPVPLRPTMLALSKVQPPKLAPPESEPVTLVPQRSTWLSVLSVKPLVVAALGMLTILMTTMLACTLVGLFTFSTPKQHVALTRRPALIGGQLPTITPTPVVGAVAEVVTSPTPPPVNSTVLPMVPTATPANAYLTPPSVASNQNTGRPTLTSRVNLNVRAGPGLNHAVVGKLVAGQSTAITGQNPDGSWWQIDYPSGSGRQAWVSANPQYSTVSQTMPQVIAQAPTPTSRPVVAVVTATSPSPASPPPSSNPVTPVAAESGRWTFTATRADAIPTRKILMLFGEMTNETGTAQQISTVTGTFYDAQGQIIAANKSTYGLWPTNVVPPGGRVPFALTVYDIQEAGNFELVVQSESVETNPRQDFEFFGVNEQMKGSHYCLAGTLKNPGGQLADYLVVAAILYDDQGNVLRFGDNNKIPYQNIVGDQTAAFEVCIKSPPANMASHELLAWGI